MLIPLLLSGCLSVAAIVYVWQTIAGSREAGNRSATGNRQPSDAQPLALLQHPLTILVLGVDADYSNRARVAGSFAGRSDTNIVVRLNPQLKRCSVLHIPRDTIAFVPGLGRTKINSANALGGPQLSENAVSTLLGKPIDHYMTVNLEGLVAMVNEVGGITVDIPKRMHYVDWTAKLNIDLLPGMHTLTGNQAMGFVRFRHDALGDIGRVQRQQIFLAAVERKLADPKTWYHLPALIRIAQQSVHTDMSQLELLSAANFVHSLPRRNIQFAMLPGTFGSSGDWSVNADDAQEFVSKYWREADPRMQPGNAIAQDAVNPARISVAIENRSSNPDAARIVSRMLRSAGYSAHTWRSSNDDSRILSTSKIFATRGNPDEADLVRSILKAGDVFVLSNGDIESRITVQVGDDMLPSLASDAQNETY